MRSLSGSPRPAAAGRGLRVLPLFRPGVLTLNLSKDEEAAVSGAG